jgi:hypothetical protein
MQEFKRLIDKCAQTCKSSGDKNVHSISYLVRNKISQSACVQLGRTLSMILDEFVIPRIPKHVSRIDAHTYVNHKTRRVIYAIPKANLYHDFEKADAICDRCVKLERKYKRKYKTYTVAGFIVSMRYYSTDDIPQNIHDKYKNLSDNVTLIGINEYMMSWNNNNNVFNNETEYADMINILANKL